MFISKKGWTLFNNADEKVVMDECSASSFPVLKECSASSFPRCLTWSGEKTMILTERELKALSGQRIKTAGGYYFEEEQDRTKYCRHPEQLDWTQPCPICKRRVRVQ